MKPRMTLGKDAFQMGSRANAILALVFPNGTQKDDMGE